MASYYIYFISSLPMLGFGMKPPFTFSEFLSRSAELIPEADVELLKMTKGIENLKERTSQPTLARLMEFETGLRNELVKIRASRKKVDAQKYLQSDGYSEPFIYHLAMNAYRNPSILDAEKILDQERWKYLEELSAGHYFDLDALLIYGIKLQILERWNKIKMSDATAMLQQALRKD